jgi:hypothetical protein
LSLSSQKYGLGIRDPEKTYSGSWIPGPGVKKAPDPGSGSATLLSFFRPMFSEPDPTFSGESNFLKKKKQDVTVFFYIF